MKRRDDLENSDLEIVWLEVFPFKSKKSICRPPSYSLVDGFESNIEQAYHLNKETILLGDFIVN